MVRIIKRYDSRKLYSPEESRYVSLEELADWIRVGEEVRVLDNVTAEDVTAQALGQVITEEGRHGRALFSSERMHELIRSSERAISTGALKVQKGVGKLLQRSIDRIGPVRRAREETADMRRRIDELEAALARMESNA